MPDYEPVPEDEWRDWDTWAVEITDEEYVDDKLVARGVNHDRTTEVLVTYEIVEVSERPLEL